MHPFKRLKMYVKLMRESKTNFRFYYNLSVSVRSMKIDCIILKNAEKNKINFVTCFDNEINENIPMFFNAN